jgi:hypothetical protein
MPATIMSTNFIIELLLGKAKEHREKPARMTTEIDKHLYRRISGHNPRQVYHAITGC